MQKIMQGSAHKIELGDKLFHAIVTSPPYYGLRSYSGEQEVEWPAVSYSPMPGLPQISFPGCDPDCEHDFSLSAPPRRERYPGDQGANSIQQRNIAGSYQAEPSSFCSKCGGWRGALGLEPTPEMYIGHLILCFRECMRVLRDDGVMWIVEGDSYAGSGKGRNSDGSRTDFSGISGKSIGCVENVQPIYREVDNLKQGDLMLIPSRLALALQADGWTIRQELVWRKLSPMPESVSGTRWERHRIKVECNSGPKRNRALDTDGWTKESHIATRTPAKYVDCPGCDDCNPNGGYVLRHGSWRHTRSHEMVIMATKCMGYFCNGDIVKETAATPIDSTARQSFGGPKLDDSIKSHAADWGKAYRDERTTDRNPRDVFSVDDIWDAFLEWYYSQLNGNPDDVLDPSQEPYRGAHYAVFPPDLITPFIRASVPSKCCPECGAGYAPVVEKGEQIPCGHSSSRKISELGRSPTSVFNTGTDTESSVLGYRPTCSCGREDWVPGTVFDPFVGSGTTLMVARELMLDAVGLDISEEYLDKHAKPRGLKQTPTNALDEFPLFAGLVCRV